MWKLHSVPRPRDFGEAYVMALADVPRTARVRPVPFGFPGAGRARGDSVGMDASPLPLSAVVARQPKTTFLVRMVRPVLLDSGIFAGDVLVVEQAIQPQYGALVVASLADELYGHHKGHDDISNDGSQDLLVRHYCPDSAAIHLLPAHTEIAPISVRVRSRCHILGVVTGVVSSQLAPWR